MYSEDYGHWQFLVHLSQRLKCTIVITRCPSSVVRRPSVRLSVVRPSLTFHIFDFSSETAERNSTKLNRKQDLNVLYQVCVFTTDRKNKMAALASGWLRHFRLLLWNRWTEFNETWQEARSQRPLPSLCFWADRKNKMAALASDWLRHFQLLLWNHWKESNETWQEARSRRPLPSLCFSGWSEKQDGRPGLWLAETFSTSPLKPLNGIQRNLTGSKILTSSTTFVFLGPIRKTRWLPWPLIGWNIFDFSSETAERNSTKLDRKQDLNVLYQVCAFRADRKNKMAALASDWLRHFRLLLWNLWTEFNETWQEARSQRPLPNLCFWADRKTRWPPWCLIGWDIFDFSTETAERNSMKLDRKQDLNVLYQVCVFTADRKNKIAALASDWLRHFRLLHWNCWTEFNKTWQEARSQRPLPSLCFLGPFGKTRWPPWSLIGWEIFDFFSETPEWNPTKLDGKQDLNVFYQVCDFQADQ